MRILIIEDEPMIRANLQELLELEDFTVEATESVENGLRHARSSKPDVVLCDWNLPDGTGADIITQITEVPIILMSAQQENTLRDEYIHRAAGYISKPFVMDTVLNEVRKVLNQ